MTIDINIGGGLGISKPEAKSLPYSEAKLVTPDMRNETFLLRNARAETIGPYKTDTVAYLKPKPKKGGKRKTKRRRHKSKRKTRSKKQGGAKIPYVGPYYENPSAKLWDGVYQNNYKMVEEAFKEGADVNMKNDDGAWFLIVAAEGGNERMVILFLEKGIDVNITDHYNNTALSTAVRNSRYDVVELLLKNGADINKENNDGDTPLMHAIIFEDYDMVELLLEDPYINIELNLATNKELALAEEMTPEGEEQNGIPYLIEDYIVTKNKIKEHKYKNIKRISNYKRPNVPKLSTLAHRQLSTSDTIEYNNAVKDNIVPPLDGKLGGKRKTHKKNSRGRKTRKKNSRGRKTRSKKQKGGDLNSELIVASKDGDFVMMMRLLEQGADINQTNSAGDTPLYVASEGGHEHIVRILLEKGADINKANIDGQTPLMMAVGMGHEEVVEALLEYGANVNAKTNEGYTAFDMLYEDEFPEIATLLKTSQQKSLVTNNIKEYKRPNIPTLRSLAHSQLDTETTSEINKINDRLLQPGKLGGKRKTRNPRKTWKNKKGGKRKTKRRRQK